MPKFPCRCAKGASPSRVRVDRLRNRSRHIAMQRRNTDGSITPLTMPNHPHIKGSTLRSILRQAKIDRDEFLRAYDMG